MDQIVKTALPIREALYPGYAFFFFFDNATSHSIYAQDALQIVHINKRTGGQQLFLRPRWFVGPYQDVVDQKISTMITNPTTHQLSVIEKDIQAILIQRGIWPQRGVILDYEKLKCTNCQTLTMC